MAILRAPWPSELPQQTNITLRLSESSPEVRNGQAMYCEDMSIEPFFGGGMLAEPQEMPVAKDNKLELPSCPRP
eukprot:5924950-Amphidinium_carterae.1